MKLPIFYEDLSVQHVGCEPPRAYTVPFGSSMEAYNQVREKSDRFQKLSGRWMFAYYDRLQDVPDDIVSKEYALGDLRTIQVPSNWQLCGYDVPQYLEKRYPFPFDPPFVPEDNPVGVYLKNFKLDEQYESFIRTLVFEGVDSCFYLYVNGSFIGYSQGSHNMSEFNVSEHLVQGENRIAVVVLKWCDGSYLEDQDKWRMSGIFRDVYLLARPRGHIRDFKINTVLSPDYRSAEILIQLDSLNPEDAVLTLYDPEGAMVNKTAPDLYGLAVFQVEAPLLWSAETPDLYTVLIEYAGEFIPERVGIREIKIQEGIFKLNGRAVKLKGVNLHPFDPVSGYAVSEEQMLRDLMLMKRNNLNAIRTAHYPPDPRFLLMCDKYGFYIIDEADLECHGVIDIGDGCSDYNLIADDAQWERAIQDRISRMVIRDKNRACVVGWSLGNECGYGCNFIKAIEWLRNEDHSRFIHYECGFSFGGKYNVFPVELDVVSVMYKPPEWCEDYMQRDPRAFILCEYAHAMGNGPGGLQEYWEMIYRNPRCMGAFVWEWCDQGLASNAGANKHKFLYGSDFGDLPNDGNFCIDGLVYPDRRPHPGLKELRIAVQPIRIEAIDLSLGEFKITNLYDFIYLSRLECVWELTRYGKVVRSGSLGALPIPPGRSESIFLDYELPKDGRCFVRICFKQLGDSMWANDGDEMAFSQFALDLQPAYRKLPLPSWKLTAQEIQDHIFIKSENFRYRYNCKAASFDMVGVSGQVLLSQPMQFIIWRAPTDNDLPMVPVWQRAGYDRAQVRAYQTQLHHNGSDVVITSSFAFAADGLKNRIKADAKWTINTAGEIKLQCQVHVDHSAPWLPRFGLMIPMQREYNGVEYFGYGPGESYIDKHLSCYKGRFLRQVRDMLHDNIRPQESGNRYATEWGAVFRQDRVGLLLCSPQGFDFSAIPYTPQELESAAHNYDLPLANKTVVYADFMQSGVGSASCGPELQEPYRLGAKNFTFHLSIRPVLPGGDPLWMAALQEYADRTQE